ncbi:putative disease resistance protein At1g63350 [Telopea speciosissima]|uniref:putative disease resistance protein At1g63350 n=1 Tax=Telopea speciosissima TaxID=54955 RepID=UPI001CC48FB5|nr:putative disease resistance protein At1g63350 [Telopea speciosissima]
MMMMMTKENKAEKKTSVLLPNLRRLRIGDCSRLKHIFQMIMVADQGLSQLEEIKIYDCPALEEIFMKSNDDGENKSSKVVLPRLRVLQLIELPNFSGVCRGVGSVLHNYFPACERLSIYGCPNLKRLPVVVSPARSSTPRLRGIETEETWFNDLEWNEPISDELHLQERVKVEFLSRRPAWFS